MRKSIILSIITASCGILTQHTAAQNFAVKVYGDVGIGKSMSLTTALPGMNTKTSSNAFGADFGYTFWRQGGSSLEANIGVGYRMASASFELPSLSYDYAAPANADEDGNPYRRYTHLSDVKQKVDLGFINVPIYLQYQYRPLKWLGIHADVGFGLGFRCRGTFGETTGTATNYGVYQEYNQLVIKADYLNDFGTSYLDEALEGEADMKGFSASVMAGAGFEFYIANPVSIDLCIRYNAGLTDVFSGHYDIKSLDQLTAETAPLTYTVSRGQEMKALSDYVTKSRMSPLSLHIGINVRF